jgi:Methyltransferase domain
VDASAGSRNWKRSKGLKLLKLIPARPGELCERVGIVMEDHWDRLVSRKLGTPAQPHDQILTMVSTTLGCPVDQILRETALTEIMSEMQRRQAELSVGDHYPMTHNASMGLAQLTYLLCRLLQPDVVLETGVANGVTSSFVLCALEQNRAGVLHSIDLAPLSGNGTVGALIPRSLRARWKLHVGLSKRVLPSLLPQIGKIGIFIHDSLHTYRNMMYEFHAVTPFLSHPAAVIADDVQDNRAFPDYVHERPPSGWAVGVQLEKNASYGVAIYNPLKDAVAS